jgi:hypothetical protein
MRKLRLYNVARRYVAIIEQMERTRDPQKLADLEEERVAWHTQLQILKREGIPFKDREHVTRLAYYIVRKSN